MAYSSWSVVFGEQPSAAKWNILGTNDASFNDGTGIFGLYENLLAVHSNPYKFSATSNTQLQTGNSAFSSALVIEDEVYDTNSNYNAATGVYTAPVAGFYHFDANLHWDAASNTIILSFFKNGSEFRRCGRDNGAAAILATIGTADMSLSASDTVDVRAFGSNNTTDEATAANFFDGHLFCRT